MSTSAFQKALERLVTEPGYCERVSKDPSLLMRDHSLSEEQLAAMRDIANNVGWDVRAKKGDDDNGGVSCCCCCMAPSPKPPGEL